MSQNINITINMNSDEEGIHVSVSSYVQPDQFDAQSMKECLHQAVDMAMARFEPSSVLYVEGVTEEQFEAAMQKATPPKGNQDGWMMSQMIGEDYEPKRNG